METESALRFDVIVIGAGLVGLAIALELQTRGAQVLVLERDRPFEQASAAAAGMLAVVDVHNPPPLHPLSRYSQSLYSAFLERLQALSGLEVPFQTSTTIHYLDEGGIEKLNEWSVDPGELGAALKAAIRAANVTVREQAEVIDLVSGPNGMEAILRSGERIAAKSFVFATGARGIPEPLRSRENLVAADAIKPLKGQMLRVGLPPALAGLTEVHRRGACYAVPRTHGPQAGSAIIGTTVEDAGFDDSVNAATIAKLRADVAILVPAFADDQAAPEIEAWAGIRPMTPDGLPILAESSLPNVFFALGHGRNGIQLAPATAMVLADLVQHKQPAVDLAAFSPLRFETLQEPAVHS